MSWSQPAAFGLLALLIPLILLYVLRIRRQRLRVASTFLWRQAQRQLLAQTPWQRLRRQRSLLLQALALVMLCMAAAGPHHRSSGASDSHLALVIDTSASMSARNSEGTTHLNKAKAAAAKLIEGMHPDADAVLIDAGRQAHLLVPATRDKKTLLRALDSIQVRHEAGVLNEGLILASNQLKSSHGSRRIVVFSDAQLAQGLAHRSSYPIDFVAVAKASDNSGIVATNLALGRDPISGRPTLRALCLVANYGRQDREMFVTMRHPGSSQPLASSRDVVGAGKQAVFELRYDALATAYGSPLVFDLRPSDAMAVDNSVFAKIPDDPRLKVTIAGKEASPWLEKAVRSAPQVEVFRQNMPPPEHANVLQRGGLLLAVGYCPPSQLAMDQLVVSPPPGSCLGVRVSAPKTGQTIQAWRRTDPRLRYIQNIIENRIASSVLFQDLAKERQLLRGPGGTLAADASKGRHSRTLLGFLPKESTWPLDNSFVLFVRNILEQSRRRSAEERPAEDGPHGVMRLELPPGVDEFVLESPQRKAQRQRARNGFAVLASRRRVGRYRLRWTQQGGGSESAFVNLHSAQESNLQHAAPQIGNLKVQTAAAAAAQQRQQPFGWYLTLLALALLVYDRLEGYSKPRIGGHIPAKQPLARRP